jgi:hypothetical protein
VPSPLSLGHHVATFERSERWPSFRGLRHPRARVSIRPSKRIRAREIAAAKSKEKVRAIAVARTKAKAKAIAAAHSPAIEAPPLPVRANIKRADVPTGVPKVVVADAKFKPA